MFNYLQTDGNYSAQYRDLFPTLPQENTIPNCAEAGVLGVLPGIIGTMQANEAIKLITHAGKPLINTLFTYNALTHQTFQLSFEPTATGRNAVPVSRETLEAMDYTIDCTIGNDTKIISIDVAQFDGMINNNNITIIDVRESGELPIIDSFSHVQMPLSAFDEKAIMADTDIVLFCQSGVRSKQAAMAISHNDVTDKKIYTLDGGITAWLAYKSTIL